MKTVLVYVLQFTVICTTCGQEDAKSIEHNELPIQKKLGECVTFTAKHYYPVNSGSPVIWQKYAFPVRSANFTYLSNDNRTMMIRAVTARDSALYSVQLDVRIPDHKTSGKEVTRYWLTVTGCDIHEKQLPLKGDCKVACEAVCPAGWHYYRDSCYKYFATPRAWENAYSYCQTHNAKLATVENKLENRFLGKLLQTGDGAWLGLNDKGQESVYIWNYNKFERPTYLAWDKSSSSNPEPNNSNGGCNIETCVEMKAKNHKWNDVVCNAHFEYVCQKISQKESASESTAARAGSSGWKCNGEKCFNYIRERVAWHEARESCHAMGATMVTISSSSENRFVGNLIKANIWLGLNDKAEAGNYVWNDVGVDEFSNRASYFNWDTGEPNDKHYDPFLTERCTGEDCVQIKQWNNVVTWCDLGCSSKIPFICKRTLDVSLSFAAWIAISMGAGLVISMVIGRVYMTAKSKKGRADVKNILKEANRKIST